MSRGQGYKNTRTAPLNADRGNSNSFPWHHKLCQHSVSPLAVRNNALGQENTLSPHLSVHLSLFLFTADHVDNIGACKMYSDFLVLPYYKLAS